MDTRYIPIWDPAPKRVIPFLGRYIWVPIGLYIFWGPRLQEGYTFFGPRCLGPKRDIYLSGTQAPRGLYLFLGSRCSDPKSTKGRSYQSSKGAFSRVLGMYIYIYTPGYPGTKPCCHYLYHTRVDTSGNRQSTCPTKHTLAIFQKDRVQDKLYPGAACARLIHLLPMHCGHDPYPSRPPAWCGRFCNRHTGHGS